MRAFIILTFTILFHLGSSIIHSFPLNDANLETQWDNISIKDFQSSQNNNNNDAAKISRLNAKFVGVLWSFYDFQKLIENTFTTSQLPTENIDLGTKNLWALFNEAPIPYMKYYMTLNCPLQSICKVKINSMQIQSDLTLNSAIQIDGITYSAYLSKPMDIILRGLPSGAVNTTFTYDKSPTVQIYSQHAAENLQIDDNKLNSLVIQLKPKIVETLEAVFPFVSKTEDIEIPNNSSELTSTFQRPNLYIIADPKEINTTNNTHHVSQCIVDNLKKDIGEIINSNFIVVTEGLTNFSSAEMQGNFVIFGNIQVKTELNTENPLRGKFLWEFSSKQNSNNYSVKVDFTIDHLYVKTEMKDIGGFLNIKPKLEMNVDIGKLQFKTSVADVIENEEKFSQCLRSIIAESVLNSSKEAINLEFGFTKPV